MKNGKQDAAAVNFEIVSRYLGWGDPNNHGLWCVGIEEGSYTYESAEDIRMRLREVVTDSGITYHPSSEPVVQDHSRFSDWAGDIPTWVAKIASGLSKTCADWRQYRETRLWLAGSHVFNANLYPLPKQRIETKPAQYARLFGVDSGDFGSYYRDRCNSRHQLLRSYWQAKEPGATICFGKREWPKFREVFGIAGTLSGATRDGGIERYEIMGRGFILAPFFGRGAMTDERARAIVRILREWNVTLP